MSEYIVSVPDEAAEYFIARFGLDGTKMMGYDLTGEIVRCRDCKHFSIGKNTDCCGFTDKYAHPNGFCSWGEKKEGGE